MPDLGQLCKLPPLDRAHIIDRHRGARVVATFSGTRSADTARTLEGRLIGAAFPHGAGASVTLVLELDSGQLAAISTATIISLAVPVAR